MQEKITVHVNMGNCSYTHDFFFGDVQDECIISLDFLERWCAVIDVITGTLQADFGVLSLSKPSSKQ